MVVHPSTNPNLSDLAGTAVRFPTAVSRQRGGEDEVIGEPVGGTTGAVFGKPV